jgi:hypothetical protein
MARSRACGAPSSSKELSMNKDNLHGVKVTTTHKLPGSDLMVLVTLIEDGAGRMVEEIFGGKGTRTITLDYGLELNPLAKGTAVTVRGRASGVPFQYEMTVNSTGRPWTFGGTI